MTMIENLRWKAITAQLATTQARVMRSVCCQRSDVGANSSRRNSSHWLVREERTKSEAVFMATLGLALLRAAPAGARRFWPRPKLQRERCRQDYRSESAPGTFGPASPSP